MIEAFVVKVFLRESPKMKFPPGSRLALILIAPLFAGVIHGQTAPPDAASQAPAALPLKSGATILSDTMGVDFSSYLRQLHADIKSRWDPLIPQEVAAPQKKKGIVGIRLTILPDGRIGAMKLETRSGDVSLDKAAWYAITSQGTFSPLPSDFHGPNLELRIGFFYNIPVAPAP